MAAVIHHAVDSGRYREIALVGISMGGSMTLKYLGERKYQVPSIVKGASAFSVPCHLGDSAKELDRPGKRFYLNRFLKKLEKKIKQKAILFPDVLSYKGFDTIRTFEEFDNRYTAPLHGFKNARHFYEQAAALPYLSQIQLPTLIVNALNDPFLPESCYPCDIARHHEHVFLQTPARGGHTGFTLRGKEENWMEVRAFEFLGAESIY